MLCLCSGAICVFVLSEDIILQIHLHLHFNCPFGFPFHFFGDFIRDAFQNDNSAMWLHGAAGSRAVSAVPPGNFYGFQGQNQPGGFRQGQQPSQYGGLGYPSFYQSQAGLPQEHPQNLTEGTLNSSQTTPSQPSHQIWQHIY